MIASAATILAGYRDQQRAHQLTESGMMLALQAGLLRRSGQQDPVDTVLLGLGTLAATLGGWNIATASHLSDPRGNDAGFLRGVACFSVTQLCYIAVLGRHGARVRPGTLLPRALAGGVGLGLIAWKDPQKLPMLGGYGGLLLTMASLAADPALQGKLDNRSASALNAGGWLFLGSDALIMLRRLVLQDPAVRNATEAVMLAAYAAAQRLLMDGMQELSRWEEMSLT